MIWQCRNHWFDDNFLSSFHKELKSPAIVIYHGFYPLVAMVYRCFKIYLLLYRVYLESLQVHVRSGEIWWFWSLLSVEPHRRVRCLAMYEDFLTVILSPYLDTRYKFELAFQCHRFQINQHHVAEVMHVLLKSGRSASREEAIEEMKERRSTVHP